ncbi:MAG: hypothetical protein ACK4GJ_02045 [bacterium]
MKTKNKLFFASILLLILFTLLSFLPIKNQKIQESQKLSISKEEFLEKKSSPSLILIKKEIYSQIEEFIPQNYLIKKYKIEDFFVEIEIYSNKNNYKIFLYPVFTLEKENQIKLKNSIKEYLKNVDKFIYLTNINQKNSQKNLQFKEIHIFDNSKIYLK